MSALRRRWDRWRFGVPSRLEQVLVIQNGTTIKASGLASLTHRPILFLIEQPPRCKRK